jgi:Protein of unknown function (DUF1236)
MNRRLIAGAAGVLLLGTAVTTGAVQAQDRGDKGQHGGGGHGGGAARAAPRAAAPQRAAPHVERSQPRAERAPQRRTVERPQRERAQQVERQRERNVQRAERQQREQKHQAERRQREQQQNAERQQREQQQAAERRQRTEGKQATSPERTGSQQVNRIHASNEQRKGVRDRIFHDGHVDRIHAKDFSGKLIVGARVDRRHYRHLHRLTPAILALAPIYAGYSYLVVDDDICIVDPATYYVVDVIPSSVEYAGGSSRPQLALSAQEMSFIYASVPKDRPVDVRIRLALGAEIPGRVDLERFPVGVTDRVPQVEGYRFIVVEDDVVIVDPQDRSVALVITG